MHAFPDGNELSAQWPLTLAEGSQVRIRFGLTDWAVEHSRDGVQFSVVATDGEGEEQQLFNQLLAPGDETIYDERWRLDYAIEKMIFQLDTLDNEYWDVLWIRPEVEALGDAEPTTEQ